MGGLPAEKSNLRFVVVQCDMRETRAGKGGGLACGNIVLVMCLLQSRLGISIACVVVGEISAGEELMRV